MLETGLIVIVAFVGIVLEGVDYVKWLLVVDLG